MSASEDEVVLEGYGNAVKEELKGLGCRYDANLKKWIAPNKAKALIAQFYITNKPRQ